MPVILPDELRRARQEAGLSQERAAQLAGVSKTTLQNAEAGRSEPRARLLAALAALYGSDIRAFFGVLTERSEALYGCRPPSGGLPDDEDPASASASA